MQSLEKDLKDGHISYEEFRKEVNSLNSENYHYDEYSPIIERN